MAVSKIDPLALFPCNLDQFFGNRCLPLPKGKRFHAVAHTSLRGKVEQVLGRVNTCRKNEDQRLALYRLADNRGNVKRRWFGKLLTQVVSNKSGDNNGYSVHPKRPDQQHPLQLVATVLPFSR